MPRRKRKAANGDGSIYRCKDGRWCAAIWLTYQGGRKKRHYYFSRDRSGCLAWLAEMRLKRARGEPIAGSDLTLLDWLRVWLERYTPNIRDSTRTSYLGYVENHISASKIASMPLAKITTDDLQRFISFCEGAGQPDSNGLSAKTVRNLFSMLHAALAQAVGNGLIDRNPAGFVQLPHVKQAEISPLTDNEITRLLAASKGERYAIGLILLLFCGFRLGELLALRHSSLREENGVHYLRVEHSLNRVSNFDAKPGDPKTVLHLGPPKSASSQRDVPLLPQVYEALLEHMARQHQEATASWGLYDGDPFLISNELGGFIDPTTFRSWFNAVCEKAGIRHVRVHDCRHTAATMMLRGCATPHEVSLILGHSSSQITERTYLHPDLGVRADAINHLLPAASLLLK